MVNNEIIAEKVNVIANEWKNFSNNAENLSSEVKEIKDQISKLKGEFSKMNIISERPESVLDFQEKSCLSNFLRSKNDLPNERKSFNSDQESGGSYLIESEKYKKIIDLIMLKSPIRQLASNDVISSNVLELVTYGGRLESGWVAEEEHRAETETYNMIQKRITVHELYAQPKATARLLNDSFINVEEWLRSKLVENFAKMENAAFVRGDGLNKPKGFLTYDDTIIERLNVADSDKVNPSDLLNLINSLDEEYLGNAHFLMHRKTLSEIQKMKDNSGRFVWQASISEKFKDTIFGVPVVCTDDMPVMGENTLPVVLADFKEAYKIVDRQGINIMKDPFTEKPFVKFYATKRVGGDVVNYNAIKILKM